MPESQLQILRYVAPGFEENGYVLYPRPGGPCWVVDPSFPPQPREMLEKIADEKLRIDAIILTHGHADHIAGLDLVREEAADAKILMPRAEHIMLSDPAENLSAAFGAGLTVAAQATGDLAPGDTLDLDGLFFTVLDTSGHSPAGRSLYCAQAGVAIVGDALFAGSIGRTDFHHSDEPTLLRNIQDNLMSLPDETEVFSGHGPPTTIGRERQSNPFLGRPLAD